jgi:hypothetical protein
MYSSSTASYNTKFYQCNEIKNLNYIILLVESVQRVTLGRPTFIVNITHTQHLCILDILTFFSPYQYYVLRSIIDRFIPDQSTGCYDLKNNSEYVSVL